VCLLTTGVLISVGPLDDRTERLDLSLVRAQMRAIEAQQHQAVVAGSEAQVARLAQLGTITTVALIRRAQTEPPSRGRPEQRDPNCR
jgi:hypothetical protein